MISVTGWKFSSMEYWKIDKILGDSQYALRLIWENGRIDPHQVQIRNPRWI